MSTLTWINGIRIWFEHTIYCLLIHIFQNLQNTSNKMEPKKRQHFLAQFFARILPCLGYIWGGKSLWKTVRNGFEKPATYKDSRAQILGIHSPPFIYLNCIVSSHRWSVHERKIMNILQERSCNTAAMVMKTTIEWNALSHAVIEAKFTTRNRE